MHLYLPCPARPSVQTSAEGPEKCFCNETTMYDRYPCVSYGSMKILVEIAKKVMKKSP